MTERQDHAARERREIEGRLASFKATQEKFAREREEYFVTTLQNARGGSGRNGRDGVERPPFRSSRPDGPSLP